MGHRFSRMRLVTKVKLAFTLLLVVIPASLIGLAFCVDSADATGEAHLAVQSALTEARGALSCARESLARGQVESRRPLADWSGLRAEGRRLLGHLDRLERSGGLGPNPELIALRALVARHEEKLEEAMTLERRRLRRGGAELARVRARVDEGLAAVPPAAPAALRADASLARARAAFATYRLAPSASAIEAAGSGLRAVREHLAALGGDGQEALVAALREEEALYDEVRALTLAELHLAGVATPEHLLEIVEAAAGLEARARSAREAFLEQRAQTRDRHGLLTLGVAGALALLLGLVARQGVRTVLHPLERLSRALDAPPPDGDRELADLEERHDEIGTLAGTLRDLKHRAQEAGALLAETRRMATQRQEVIDRLQATNRELESFAHAASHDLKAPLRAMNALAEWIEEDCSEELPDIGREHIERLKQRITRMERLLDSLLAYSRASQLDFEMQEVHTHELLHEVVHLVSPREGFDIAIEGDDPTFHTARVPLEQVLSNLIGNAVKHHDRPDGRVIVTVQDAAKDVTFRIEDDGPGIPERYHAAIFQPFRTLRPRDRVEGSGIGLALVKKHIERYRGAVSVRSRPGRGTVFEVRWPKDPHRHEEDSRQAASSTRESRP